METKTVAARSLRVGQHIIPSWLSEGSLEVTHKKTGSDGWIELTLLAVEGDVEEELFDEFDADESVRVVI